MTTLQFDDVAKLIEFLNELPNPYVYRGHADASWKLESTLERTLRKKWTYENVRRYEKFSLVRFKAKFHLYDSENYEPKSVLSWLSMMQHYGVPTRLIDFTESPYVALYFALEFYEASSSNDFAVYVINYTSLREASLFYIKKLDSKFNETRESIIDREEEVFARIDNLYNIAWITEPGKLNFRMDRQAGSFLVSLAPGEKLEDVLNADIYKECKMFKCIISGQLYDNVYALLRKMNLNASVIYGDLTGLAKSIRMEMQAHAS